MERQKNGRATGDGGRRTLRERLSVVVWGLSVVVTGGLLCVSCDLLPKKTTAPKVAEVNGKTLLLSDIKDIFPTGISADDSLVLLRNYVNNWARKQLIAGIAEQHLSKEEKDVSRELEDYRLSILIFRYEQLYLSRRFDTVVSDHELEAFYATEKRNFILTKPIAKALFIKVAEDIPQVKKIAQLYYSNKPADREELLRICSSVAEICTNFDERWVSVDFLADELPMSSQQVESHWATGFFTTQADGYKYFVHLYEKKAAGSPAPLDYERATISRIIRNRRNQEMLKKLETTIFNNALDHNQLKIYIDNDK
jgi:hypothetical protein